MTAFRENSGRSTAAAVAVAFLAAALLTGCSQPAAPGPGPAASGAPDSATAMPATAADSGGAAGAAPASPSTTTEVQAKSAAVSAALKTLAAGAPQPSRQQLQDAFVQAGLPADKLEVSLDRTPTGLNVDAIEAAAPVEGQCIIGQVRAGSVQITILPVLASGLCFIGDQH